MLLVEVETPVVVVVVPVLRKIVDVGALGMQDLAEQPLLGHVETRQFEEVVNAVLEHHAVTARALRGVDQLPALLDVGGGGNLDGHMLAVLHGVNGQRHMVHPVGGDVDQVDIVTLAKLFVSLGAYVLVGRRLACIGQSLLALGYIVGLKIAQTFDLDPVDMGETVDGGRTAHAESDESYADHGNGIGGESEHRLLAGGARRLVEYDDAVLQFVVVAGNSAVATTTLHQHSRQECCACNK